MVRGDLATSESPKVKAVQEFPWPAQRLARCLSHWIQRAGSQSSLGTTTASIGSTYVSDRDRLASIEGSVHSHVVGLLRQHHAAEGKVVLDLGCGFGATAEAIRDFGFSYVGLDSDPRSVQELTQRGFVGSRI